MDNEMLTHLDEHGRARMVDVGNKPMTRRRATAEGSIRMEPETLNAIRSGGVKKGDVLAVARLAAIGGAKRTADTIPLCHPLPLDSVAVEMETDEELPGVRIRVETSVEARTGVEMEALCGVSAGLLAVYDMCKGMDRGMQISEIRLVAKQGGRSGAWNRAANPQDERP
ncbi:MAG: cyclic pyranopterin monophosphate synthase MoaC [Gemmatimonadota bacterium]